jgi:hypothetical protein
MTQAVSLYRTFLLTSKIIEWKKKKIVKIIFANDKKE